MSHLQNVCKPFTMETCRYLVMDDIGFMCAKLTGAKATIDNQVESMRARGDNCEGKPFGEVLLWPEREHK